MCNVYANQPNEELKLLLINCREGIQLFILCVRGFRDKTLVK